ncbi:ATP-binding protein [Leptospira sp. 'Mane']|uniref:ATP-binding protein n=1 Tax=Leptospira sp. 'Mane' TaxID=3387407 RepID=UPI00398B7FF4
MEKFTIQPKVDQTQEFIEIANDFSNPLELVREAISNSYDAKADRIRIIFEVIKELGEPILKISLSDNGKGMDLEGLQSFFDLGNSTKRNDIDTIGEKGHGTKVYFNCKRLELQTSNGKDAYLATMEDPFRKLYNRELPTIEVKKIESRPQGTEITIYGYNNNRRDKFTHSILKDYIQWYTKHGSIDHKFSKDITKLQLYLKGLEKSEEEEIIQGHHFPSESDNITTLFNNYLTKAPDYYSKQIIRSGSLKNFPEIKFHAIFSIEGKYIKYGYNEMLRRPGYTAPEGSYTIQERYGLWLCKDFIPIQRKNEWITFKGSEYTKFHAFINCQDLRLTANRGSIDNTPSEIINDIKNEVTKIYESILSSDDWTSIEWLEDEAFAYQTKEKEAKNFSWRIKKVNRSNIAYYENIQLVEPERESGVFAIFLQINLLNNSIFPFTIIDYDTHEGIDVIVKSKSSNLAGSASSKLFYVEFKRTLSNGFNHSFENLHSIICWDTDIKHEDILKDINNEERKMMIISPIDENDYTRYYLENPRKAHRIEVFCLKIYLKEKLGIEFRPRNQTEIH